MKTTAAKAAHITATKDHGRPARPFFAKGGGDFFAPAGTSAPPSVQAKLTVNTPGDRYEAEADKMADRVMRMAGSGKLRKENEPESMQERRVQRKETASTPAIGQEPDTRQSEDAGSLVTSRQTESVIRSRTSGGQTLPADSRDFMEPRFGNDFSGVRIHNDQEAAELNNQLNARAFTYQNHIFFGPGQYRPNSPQGKQLLAHELTHVVQQGAAKGLNTKSEKSKSADGEQLHRHLSQTGTTVIQRGLLDDLKQGVNTVTGAIGDVINGVRQALGAGISAATTWIRNIASAIGSGITEAWYFVRNVASTIRQGVGVAWGWIQNISSTLALGISASWTWIRDLANSLAMGITAGWTWIQTVASKLGMRITNGWNFIRSLASRIAMGITSGWNWIQSVASGIGMAITNAWNWIQDVGARIGMHLPPSWNWLKVLASRLAMGITNAWNFVQRAASNLAMNITNGWNWIQNTASTLAMAITDAWNWVQTMARSLAQSITNGWNLIQQIAARLAMAAITTAWNWVRTMAQRVAMTIAKAWHWVQSVASRLMMAITTAWNWVQTMARSVAMTIAKAWIWVQSVASRLGMVISRAWNWVKSMAGRIASAIVRAWNWLVSLAKKLIRTILEAWDWYWNAPDIEITTTLDAADGSGKSRKKVGVGEVVTFRGSKSGDWTASGGSPLTQAGTFTFVWTAPVRGASVTVSLTSGKYTRSVVMNVLEPNRISARRTGVMSFTRGRLGAGMRLKFQYLPNSVSFGNVESKEVSGPATNISGYFKGRTGAFEWHNSGDSFLPVQANNEDSATDEAGFWGYPPQWRKGRYDWVIPNHFKVKSEGGDGKKFTEVNQVHTIEGTDGTAKVTKAGAEVERTP